jgi:hypothetical protein
LRTAPQHGAGSAWRSARSNALRIPLPHGSLVAAGRRPGAARRVTPGIMRRGRGRSIAP